MPTPELERLLAVLPDDTSATCEFTGEPEVLLEGFLLRGDAATVRIVTGHLCLEFAVIDVLGAEELELPDGIDPALAVPARLRLRAGAALLRATPSEVYEPLLYKVRRPFAIAVRTSPPGMQASPRFERLQTEFRREHGLE